METSSDLSSEISSDFDLTLTAKFQKMSQEDLDLLYPKTDSSYFASHQSFETKKSVVDKYNEAPAKPYIKVRDANNQGNKVKTEKSKSLWEIGLEWLF